MQEILITKQKHYKKIPSLTSQPITQKKTHQSNQVIQQNYTNSQTQKKT